MTYLGLPRCLIFIFGMEVIGALRKKLLEHFTAIFGILSDIFV